MSVKLKLELSGHKTNQDDMHECYKNKIFTSLLTVEDSDGKFEASYIVNKKELLEFINSAKAMLVDVREQGYKLL
jgi:hypothetical protein